jgi:putative ABC transport system ATP-binding protein
LLLDVKRQFGKTVVVITHNVVIGEVADRVVRLRSGQIVDVTVNRSPVSPEEISW